MDSLGTSFTDEPEGKSRRKKRHDTSTDQDFSPGGGETGDLMDDLQYSSEEEDDEWDEVEDSQDQGFTIAVDQQALLNPQEPVLYYPTEGMIGESAGPMFNIQV